MDNKPKPVTQLPESRCQDADYARMIKAVTVEPGTTRADVLNPAFWSHTAYQLRPYTKIEVRCDDGTFFAELLVTAAERTWAKVHVLSWTDLTSRDVSETQAEQIASPEPSILKQFSTEWKGPHRKWSVIRTCDQEYLHDGEDSREAADKWLREYQKAMA